tara:strand:- start:34 stop:537 length:504 start_codon:yes stop_codon:yes gene_type:complete
MIERIKQIIDKLELYPHPEGGFYREVYRSEGLIKADCLEPDMSDERNYSTCIYYLLSSSDYSAFHRIKQDELWHHYEGSSLRIHILLPDGTYKYRDLGNDLENDQHPMVMVPAKAWFAAEVMNKESYTLCGCTVAPGFDFADFELAESSALKEKYPVYSELIENLCT